MPEDDNAAADLQEVFSRLDETMGPIFPHPRLQWAVAFTTIDWMRGRPLRAIIQGAINRSEEKDPGGEVDYAGIIRNTMKFVEEFARFKAPKYLSAYLDVLKVRYNELGQAEAFPSDLPFDLYLEFGVSSETLLSFIGLGLSRTSAIEIDRFLAREGMSEDEALAFLIAGSWETYEMPKLVKREIRTVLQRRVATI